MEDRIEQELVEGRVMTHLAERSDGLFLVIMEVDGERAVLATCHAKVLQSCPKFAELFMSLGPDFMKSMLLESGVPEGDIEIQTENFDPGKVA